MVATPDTETAKPKAGKLTRLRAVLRNLYHGESRSAWRFQLAVIVVDFLIIAFFIVSPLLRGRPSFLWVDYSIAALLAADIGARALASRDPWRWVRRPTSLVDILILATLLAPLWLANLGFLRVLRLWSLSRSGFLWRTLARRGYETWREVVHSTVNVVTFLFVVTGFIYTFFFREDAGIAGYIDALYYTVASMTTTGYGDVVLPGMWGKLTSIAIMIAGITLFIRLAQAIFRPYKVHYGCPQCGLQRHDPDAVHCKACGYQLKIPDPDD